jgi:hypothetical protein
MGNLGSQDVSLIVVILWFWCWRFVKIFLKSYFPLVFCIAFWVWNCMFSLQFWSFYMIETYNMFVQLVFKKNYDYLLFNVAKIKCSFYALIWFKHLKRRISLGGFDRTVIENDQIHDVTYTIIFKKDVQVMIP